MHCISSSSNRVWVLVLQGVHVLLGGLQQGTGVTTAPGVQGRELGVALNQRWYASSRHGESGDVRLLTGPGQPVGPLQHDRVL